VIDPKMQAEIEQDSSGITEMIAMLFRNLVNEGLSHALALEIVKHYMTLTLTKGQ
jgi:hypothetical protein